MTAREQVYEGEALAARMRELPSWRTSDGWLRREYRTDGWRSTMLLVNAIAFLAEAADHHPDLEVHWGSVAVSLQTHSAGGITDLDFQLAQRIETLVLWRPEKTDPARPAGDWIKG